MGVFSKLTDGSPLVFRTKGEATHPELLEKEEGEAEGWGKREFPGSMHGNIPAVQVNPAQRQYWSTWKQRVTFILRPQKP
jgi:hypothetical protein